MGSLEDKVKWSQELSGSVAPLDFYRGHYPNITRGQLQKQDQNLYQRLWRDGLLEHVPTIRAEARDFGNDPLAYYQKHYPNLTRGELKKQDRSLYETLRRNKLLEQIPRAEYAPRPSAKARDSGRKVRLLEQFLEQFDYERNINGQS